VQEKREALCKGEATATFVGRNVPHSKKRPKDNKIPLVLELRDRTQETRRGYGGTGRGNLFSGESLTKTRKFAEWQKPWKGTRVL